MMHTSTMTEGQRETQARAILRQFGLEVESVAWVKRHADEFAAIVVWNGREDQMDHALTVLNDPRCPLRIVREHVGERDTRLYVSF